MVIFRIIINLFGIISRLGFNLLWFPVFILTRHLFLTVMLVGVFIAYLYLTSDDQATRQAENANPATMVRTKDGKMMQVVTPVRRIENGDSAFTNDLYQQMTPEERGQYSQYFYWAMDNVADGGKHRWSNLDIGGVIAVGNSFTNKTGERCRMFSEVLKVHAVQQNISGMACENGSGGWCKLQSNATPACGLGASPGFIDSIKGSLDKLF